MSSNRQDKLIDAIGLAIMRWQDATEAFDETVGRIHDLNSADRRCLGFVGQSPQTPGAIARETALSPAAVTALIDRLETRGLVRRRPDPDDRRRVLVEATDTTHELIHATYAPIARAGARLLGKYSIEELTAILRFLEEALALQRRMTARLLEREKKSRR